LKFSLIARFLNKLAAPFSHINTVQKTCLFKNFFFQNSLLIFVLNHRFQSWLKNKVAALSDWSQWYRTIWFIWVIIFKSSINFLEFFPVRLLNKLAGLFNLSTNDRLWVSNFFENFQQIRVLMLFLIVNFETDCRLWTKLAARFD